MADTKKQHQGSDVAAQSSLAQARAQFEALQGQQIFTDRPIVNFKDLGDNAGMVKGWLVCEEELNLPLGAPPRKDGRKTWDAYVIHLTHPTRALDGQRKVIDVAAGREVYLAVNPKSEALRGFLGKDEMVEVAIVPTGLIDVGRGKNPMQGYDFKVMPATKTRTGAFLIGGPGQTKILRESSLEGAIGEIEHAAGGTQPVPVANP